MTLFETDRTMPSATRADKVRGVHIGVVTDNKDPDKMYRVKIKLPWLSADDTTFFARIAVPMAGAKRGTYFLPEVDDQVLVVFEHGDIERPIIIGALWNSPQEPPQQNTSGKNEIKVLKSKAGSRIVMSDTDGSEKVTIVDKTKKNQIVLDSANKKVLIECEGDIEIKAQGAVRMHGSSVLIKSDGEIKGKGGAKLGVGGGQALCLKASGTLTLKGATVMVNCPGGPLMPATGGVLAAAAGAVQKALDQIVEQAGGGGGGGGGGALSNRATDGIDISEWQLALPAGARHKTVTFSAWDFAGQEVYYSTHQFFLNAYVSAS